MFIAFFKEFYLLDGGYFPLKKVKPRSFKKLKWLKYKQLVFPITAGDEGARVAVPEHFFCYKLSQYSK